MTQPPAKKGDRFQERAGKNGTPVWTVSYAGDQRNQMIQMYRPGPRTKEGRPSYYMWMIEWPQFVKMRSSGQLTRVP